MKASKMKKDLGDLSLYLKAGYSEYEFMATSDDRTCPSCSALDGKHFLINDAIVGLNYPPMHEGCRCTTIAYDQEDEVDFDDQSEVFEDDYSLTIDNSYIKKTFKDVLFSFIKKKRR